MRILLTVLLLAFSATLALGQNEEEGVLHEIPPAQAAAVPAAATRKILLFAPSLTDQKLAESIHARIVSAGVPLYLIFDPRRMHEGNNTLATFALLTVAETPYPVYVRYAPPRAFEGARPYLIVDDRFLLLLPYSTPEGARGYELLDLKRIPAKGEERAKALRIYRRAAAHFNYWWRRSEVCELGVASLKPVRLTCKKSEWFIFKPEAWQ